MDVCDSIRLSVEISMLHDADISGPEQCLSCRLPTAFWPCKEQLVLEKQYLATAGTVIEIIMQEIVQLRCAVSANLCANLSSME